MFIIRALLSSPVPFFLVLAPASAQEQSAAVELPKVFEDVVGCRQVEEPMLRLACYDTNVKKLESAQQTKQLYITDQEQVQKSRKVLFGFSLPKLGIFKNADSADITSIESKILAVRQGQRGWIFELHDGAVWGQTDSRYYGRSPKPGQTLYVKKAAMGSYMAKVDSGAAFRAERLNRSAVGND